MGAAADRAAAEAARRREEARLAKAAADAKAARDKAAAYAKAAADARAAAAAQRAAVKAAVDAKAAADKVEEEKKIAAAAKAKAEKAKADKAAADKAAADKAAADRKVLPGMVVTLKGLAGKFCGAHGGKIQKTCDKASAGPWERFRVYDAGSGNIALRVALGPGCHTNGKSVPCKAEHIPDPAKMLVKYAAGGRIALQQKSTKKYCTTSSWCDTSDQSAAEKFWFTCVSGCNGIATDEHKAKQQSSVEETTSKAMLGEHRGGEPSWFGL